MNYQYEKLIADLSTHNALYGLYTTHKHFQTEFYKNHQQEADIFIDGYYEKELFLLNQIENLINREE